MNIASHRARSYLLVASILAASAAQSSDAGPGGTSTRQITIGSKKTITHTIELPQQSGRVGMRCEAEVSISYTKMVKQVRVKSSITNQDCVASSGEYIMQLKTRSDKGESLTREFTETWARTSNSGPESEKHYDIGDHVELIWARVRRASCLCSERIIVDEGS